jgi:hypothetical protein
MERMAGNAVVSADRLRRKGGDYETVEEGKNGEDQRRHDPWLAALHAA